MDICYTESANAKVETLGPQASIPVSDDLRCRSFQRRSHHTRNLLLALFPCSEFDCIGDEASAGLRGVRAACANRLGDALCGECSCSHLRGNKQGVAPASQLRR